MKVFNTQRLVINYWTRVPLTFIVKVKYTNSSSNNEDNFIIPIAKATITKQTEQIQLIEGTVQSVSILTPSDNIQRGHIFFQCWVCDINSIIPIHILFSDYLTTPKPIGFPFTGIQDNGYDIDNGLLIHNHEQGNDIDGNMIWNCNRNVLCKIEEIGLYFFVTGVVLALNMQFQYYDSNNIPSQTSGISYLIPALAKTTSLLIRRNAHQQAIQTDLDEYRLYDIPIIPNSDTVYTIITTTISPGIITHKDKLRVTTKELINIK